MQPDFGERLQRGTRHLQALGFTETPELITRLRREHPALADHIVAFVFGDIYTRETLTTTQRQLVTLGCLTALGDTEAQLRAHAALSLSAGMSGEQIREAVLHAGIYAGFPRAISATLAITPVLEDAPSRDDQERPQ